MKYRRRDAFVEAIQWLGDNSLDVAEFLGVDFLALKFTDEDALIIEDDEAAVGEWIMRKGDKLIVWGDTLFNALYEPVEPEEGATT